MKYAQLVVGLLAGSILGAGGMASTGKTAGGLSKEEVQQIVRDTISNEPKLILDSVQKYQIGERDNDTKEAAAQLKDPAVHAALFDTPDTAYAGNKDGKKVMIEFFDYNCPACKVMFGGIDRLVKEDKEFKIIFKEFPIFGPSSDNNAKRGLAIWKLYPDRYFEFHEKMMAKPGHGEEKVAHEVIKEMGLDAKKIEDELKNPEYAKMIDDNRQLGEKLRIQGTPFLIIGDELIPSALRYDDLKAKVDAIK